MLVNGPIWTTGSLASHKCIQRHIFHNQETKDRSDTTLVILDLVSIQIDSGYSKMLTTQNGFNHQNKVIPIKSYKHSYDVFIVIASQVPSWRIW